MSDGDPGDLAERPVDEAAEIVVDRGQAADRAAAASTLETVAEDGVVTRDGLRAALGHLSTVVSTTESRLELTERAYREAASAAGEDADRAVVASRLDGAETRLEAVGDEVADISRELAELERRGRAEVDLFEVAREIDRLEESANARLDAAEELAAELEDLERWLVDPAGRYEALSADVDAVAEALDGLEGTVDALAAAKAEGRGLTDEVAAAWFDAAIRHRAMALMLADLGWELGELRRWTEEPAAEEIGTRLSALADRRGSIGEGLNDVTGTDHVRRFSRALAAVDREFEAMEPPVEWSVVEETLEEHRSAALGAD